MRTFVSLAITVILGASLMVGCGEDAASNQPTGPPPPPMDVESGTFEVTSVVSFNGCDSGNDYNRMYEVQFTDTSFVMGNWKGEWTATASRVDARGETAHSKTYTRDCTITRWSVIDITFKSNDEFSGHITYRYRVAGTCLCCEQCHSTWLVSGVRVTQ